MRGRTLLSFALLVAVLAPPAARSDVAQTYLVGAAVRSIDPSGEVNLGGFGLGDGSSLFSQLVGPGNRGRTESEHIAARAVVIDDGETAVALVTVETQGMFAAYQGGAYGLDDIVRRVAADIERLRASNIVISNDHSHAGPDAIGAWGFVPNEYMDLIADRTVEAIEAAYAARAPVTMVAGADEAGDLMYSQTCTEAINQQSIPNLCDPTQERKDTLVRVLQARDASTGAIVLTLMAYGAHATLGGAGGVHGDWPQFMSDRLSAVYGGTGVAMQGTNGRTQPCRPRCYFTDPSTPGYGIADRKTAYTTMLLSHVDAALAGAEPVAGPVAARKAFIRHEVENPVLTALLLRGDLVGAPIQRSQSAPWLVGNIVQTVVSAVRIGDLLVNGAPGEPYPNIPEGVEAATGVPAARHWTLALADDQLGYLIAPVEAYPIIASQAAVNDNPLFNVSPTIGDHVMCTQTRLAALAGFSAGLLATNPRCPVWDAWDLVTGAP